MGHSYNHSLVSSNKGSAIETISVSFSSGAPTIVDDGKAGFISDVAHTATGRYTFTIAAPIPPTKMIILPSLSCVSATGALLRARYVEDSYDADAGTFEIDVTDTSVAAADPTDATTLDVLMVFQRYSNL